MSFRMVAEKNLKDILDGHTRDVKLRAALILEKLYLPLEALVEKEREHPGRNKLFIKELATLAASLKRDSEKLTREASKYGRGTKPV